MSDSEMSDKHPAGRDRYGKLKRHSRAGRDTPREKLDVPLTVRLSVTEREAIGDRARVLGVTKSVWARAVMRDALDTRRSDVQRIHDGADESPHPDLAAAVEQVRRLGINVNQALKRSQVIEDALLAEVVVALDATRAALGDRTRL